MRATIRSMLTQGDPSAGAVAARLSMSDRTLRRRLRYEATSYQEVLDDVALRRGFSDASAFTKAFRRWTGQSPADFARAHSS
jgi:AraC-like DNA-binding protein